MKLTLHARPTLTLDPRASILYVTWWHSSGSDENRLLPSSLDVSAVDDSIAMHIVGPAFNAVICPHAYIQKSLDLLKQAVRPDFNQHNASQTVPVDSTDHNELKRRIEGYCSLAITGHIFNGWENVPLVPPDPFMEIVGDRWYDSGILREWHKRRRWGIINDDTHAREYEQRNHLVLSYVLAPEGNGGYGQPLCTTASAGSRCNQGITSRNKKKRH